MAIDFMKPVKTRDGREVRIICLDAPGEKPVVGFVDDLLLRWNFDGCIIKFNPSTLDLVQAPMRKSAWMIIYPVGARYGTVHETYDAAERQGDLKSRVVEIHWEE